MIMALVLKDQAIKKEQIMIKKNIIKEDKMKIAITSKGPTLDEMVESRFGRCPYFIIVDSETMEFEKVPNPSFTTNSGAGFKSAQLLVDKDISVVLTGNCGPNASQILNAAGIKVISGIRGHIRQVIQLYNSGTLKGTSELDSYDFPMMGKGIAHVNRRGHGNKHR